MTDISELNLYKPLSLSEVIDAALRLTEETFEKNKYILKQIYYNLKKITYDINSSESEVVCTIIYKGLQFTIFNTLSYYYDKQLDDFEISILVIPI
jgi:hypothetical protein